MSEGEGSFLARWSARKHHHRIVRADAPASAHEALDAALDGRNAEPFADFDFDSLSFSSNYTRFMAGSVPEHVRCHALRKLWTSSDIISQADELDDYLEDFREEAMALPAEMVRSAYRVGRGFVENQQDANETDEQTSASELTDSKSKTVDAPAIMEDPENITQREFAEIDKSPPETDKLPS